MSLGDPPQASVSQAKHFVLCEMGSRRRDKGRLWSVGGLWLGQRKKRARMESMRESRGGAEALWPGQGKKRARMESTKESRGGAGSLRLGQRKKRQELESSRHLGVG